VSVSVNADLGESHIFLTGGTGFVGQAVLERLITSHPRTRISLLVRPKGRTRGEDRLRNLLRKPVFRSWREDAGPDEFERTLRERISVVEGTLDSLPPLPGDIDIVIHSASTVSFDPPVDQAFDTNVGGALGLYGALAASGSDPHVVHVSTAYVGGIRKGIASERRLTHEVDWRPEYDAARSARGRVELSSRQPEQLSRFMAEARARHGKEGPQAVARASEQARIDWVQARLVELGRIRAESLGWTDVYTLTKAFAERVAEELWSEAGHSLSIVRPSIIESALVHPYPGWIDGFKVADPIILAYGRGLLPEFPGLPDSILDVVPVDYVVNVILAVAANPPALPEAAYFHASSGSANPLPVHRMFRNVQDFFTANPLPQPGEGHVQVPTWKFPGGRKVERSLRARQRMNALAEGWYSLLPVTAGTRSRLARTRQRGADLETLRDLSSLYRAYVQTETIFDDKNTTALLGALPVRVRDEGGFDVRAIDWEDYLQNVHFPSITSLTRAFTSRSGSGSGSGSVSGPGSKKGSAPASAPGSGAAAPASGAAAPSSGPAATSPSAAAGAGRSASSTAGVSRPRARTRQPSHGAKGRTREKSLPRRPDVLAVFDLEGTVVDSNIVEQYLWVRSAGFGWAAWPGEALRLSGSLASYLRAERHDRGEFIRLFLRRYGGMPVARMKSIVRGGYRATMLRHTSPDAIERIRAHREAGHRTVLVTGSIGELAAPIAELFDEVVASSMDEKDGVLTGYLAKPPLVDEARAAWLRHYADEHGLDLAHSYGYGDSHADLVWLELLGHPSAVNPDSALWRAAERRHWPVRSWRRRGGVRPVDLGPRGARDVEVVKTGIEPVASEGPRTSGR
jgi:HAD superfamily hydrolase (TIGR01490 family)